MTRRDASAAGLLAVLVAYLGLSALYHRATPPLEASDEAGHVAHALHLKSHRRLAVAHPLDESPLSSQEYAQPPLYYAAGALLIAPIDTSDHLDFYHRRPGSPIGRADLPGPKNMFVPVPGRTFPGTGTALAIAVLRVFSCLLGAGSVAAAWLLARRLGGAPWTASVAAGLVAFNPMFLFIAGSANNDNLVTLLSSAALLVILRGVDRGLRDADSLAAGVAIGAAVLAKASGLILLPVAALAAVASAPTWGRWARSLLLSLTAVAAVAGWWFAWNLHHYGQWLPVDVQAALAWNLRPARDWFALLKEWSGFEKSFWGVFGAFNVVYPEWAYAFFRALTVGGAALVVHGWSKESFRPRSTAVLLGALVAANLAAVALWTSTLLGSQGRLMFPSLPAMAALAAVALQALPPRIGKFAGAAACAALAALAAYGALAVIPAQYPR